MRIEVLIGNDDPLVFPIKSSKITIGSSETCDIQLETGGISRKHISVLTEGDQYFIVDQGSTNGTFVNEERLIPGKKIEFTSFFPVRLGDNVLISLLSDEDGMENISIPFGKESTSPNLRSENLSSGSSDKTTVISLKDLKKVKTDELVANRDQKRVAAKKKIETKSSPKKEPKKNIVPYIAFLILVGGAIYNFFFIEDKEKDQDVAQVGRIIKKGDVPVQAVEEKKVNSNLIPDDELVAKDSYSILLNDIKCTTDIEKYFCDMFPDETKNPYGVAQKGLTINLMLDGTKWFLEGAKFAKKPIDNSPDTLVAYEKLVYDTGIYIFLLRHLSPIDEAMLADYRLSFAFYRQTEDGPKLERVMAIKPSVFNKLNEVVKEENLYHIRDSGSAALLITNEYYKVY